MQKKLDKYRITISKIKVKERKKVMSKRIAKREEIKREHKWKIEDLYENNSLWEQEYKIVKEIIKELETYQGQLTKSADNLVDFLKKKDKAEKYLERIYVYANQRYHEDTTNAYYQNLCNQAEKLMVEFESAVSFFTSDILNLSEEQFFSFLKENSQLVVYQYYLEKIINRRKHILEPKIEKILAQAKEMAEGAETIFSMFNNADLKFPEIKDEKGELIELSHSRYMTFLQSKNREVRKTAFLALYHTYFQFKNMLAATFRANIKKEIFYAKVRNYCSSIEMNLESNDIPISVYNKLIETVHQNLYLMHRYISVRKKALSLEKIHMYDLYTPIVLNTEIKISFEKAKSIVKEGLEPLGKDYQDILVQGYEKGWIDVYENEGKRSGAYSWGAYGTHPYILLNYQDTLNDIFTLAHEMGHAIHSYYSDAAQPYIYSKYKIFVAEVASTCNEALLMHYLLKHAKDKKERAYLINYYLEQFRTTLYRQTMFAEFEQLVYKMVEEEKAVTAESLCEIYGKLNKEYFGDEIIIDPEIKIEWARIPHFYTPFYVYQYATGYSAAIALSQRILEKGERAVKDYIQFLKGGSSQDPIDLLKGAGVDMTTSKPIEKALMIFKSLLEEMETLLTE